jgi:pimeloyl-ACP methyl ester carboxylesterase
MSTAIGATGAAVEEPAGRTVDRDGEQSRARYPDEEGFAERDGQRLYYEVYGEGEETIFLMPTWSLVHSRKWKMQIPYLARHFRVLTMDGLGNGRSSRCRDPRRYRAREFARDCLAVMDATGTERAVVVSVSTGAQYQLELARIAPERIVGTAFTGPLFPYTPSHIWMMRMPGGWRLVGKPLRIPQLYRWWARYNVDHWREDYPAFAEWFVSRCVQEPHSTKAIEDGVAWALDTDPETLSSQR